MENEGLAKKIEIVKFHILGCRDNYKDTFYMDKQYC